MILEGKRKEQEDVLMFMLYSLAQYGTLQEMRVSLRSDEYLFVSLDDIYVDCVSERVSRHL